MRSGNVAREGPSRSVLVLKSRWTSQTENCVNVLSTVAHSASCMQAVREHEYLSVDKYISKEVKILSLDGVRIAETPQRRRVVLITCPC